MTDENIITEQWKPIPDWEGLYDISSYGRARVNPDRPRSKGLRAGRILPFHVSNAKDLSYRVRLTYNRRTGLISVKRLVAEVFLSSPTVPSRAICVDGNQRNCAASNLKYDPIVIPHKDCILCLSPVSDATLGYFAGMMDGEGSITIVHQAIGNGTQVHEGRIFITNTDKNVIEWLVARFGGHLHANNPKPPRRQCYRWTEASLKSAAILEHVQPYLLIKREQAEIYIRFRLEKHVRALTHTSVAIDRATFERREDMRIQLRNLTLWRNRPSSLVEFRPRNYATARA